VASRLITKVLVPNRGEIAVRIARACREMGIASVLAHAEDDLDPFVAAAFDELVSLGAGAATDTYLVPSKIVDAARSCGADAVHPGYGFLSERAAMAAAADDAGIIFIGPSAEVIETMGSKAESRHRMARLGVPVIPGYDGDDQANDTLAAEAERVGYPLLVKASAGGGGKGMKLVRDASALEGAIEAARREASAAFGDDRLLIERYLDHPRHVEFQVFGDATGTIVHLFERDCSIQRRHQKVIEETPAPRFSADLRRRMGESAVAAAAGVGYRNAGTVEFIVAGDEYFFLEMNTRLQVEHPITEMVVGVDLVRAQIEIASGSPLPWRQEDLAQRGHAIEFRIYAEDPDRGFLPQTGTIGRYREPSGPGVRVDAGVAEGSEVSVRFDPLLAKLICFAPERAVCIERSRRALGEYLVLGTITNLAHLRRVAMHDRFVAGDYSTHLLSEIEADLGRRVDGEAASVGAVLGSIRGEKRESVRAVESTLPSIWDSVGNWGR